MTKKIAVIDLDSVCYTIAHPEKVTDEGGEPIKIKSAAGNMVFQYKEKTLEQMLTDVDKVMEMILTESGASHWIGYMKGRCTTNARLDINPDYKGNRTKEEPWWWKPIQEELYIKGARYVDWMEVDDAVNITRWVLANSFITAIDGDLLGLQGTHYNWRKKEWVTVSYEQAIAKFWRDMIVGQPGDNIKGLPGRGEKFWRDQYQNTPAENMCSQVFEDYTRYLAQDLGIHEFYKNYVSLKILEKKEGFVIPEPNEFIIKQKEEESNLFT